MKKTTILSILLLLIVFSCKKKVVDVNQDFIGNWSGSDSEAGYTINVQSDGNATYYKLKGGSKTEINGSARIKDDIFKIFTKKFKIDQLPTKYADNFSGYYYKMTLDGIEYNRWE